MWIFSIQGGGKININKFLKEKVVSLDELPRNETLLEKDIVYLKNRKFYRGTVIGRMGANILVKKKDLFNGEEGNGNLKEKIRIEYVVGVVKDEEN